MVFMVWLTPTRSMTKAGEGSTTADNDAICITEYDRLLILASGY